MDANNYTTKDLFSLEPKDLVPSLLLSIHKRFQLTNMSSPMRLSSAESTSSSESLTDAQLDGSIDLATSDMPQRRRLSGDVCAIFVHAGAGYHSFQNEKVHLAACEE